MDKYIKGSFVENGLLPGMTWREMEKEEKDWNQSITSPEVYLKAVSRLLIRRGIDIRERILEGLSPRAQRELNLNPYLDDRIQRSISAGFGWLRPTEMLSEKGVAWIRYYCQAVAKFGHALHRDILVKGFRSGVPPILIRKRVWEGGFVPRKAALQRAAKAVARRSVRRGQVDIGALAELGRLSSMLQRAALYVSGYYTREMARKIFRAKDINWAELAKVQAGILANPKAKEAWENRYAPYGTKSLSLTAEDEIYLDRGVHPKELAKHHGWPIQPTLVKKERRAAFEGLSAKDITAWLKAGAPRFSDEAGLQWMRAHFDLGIGEWSPETQEKFTWVISSVRAEGKDTWLRERTILVPGQGVVTYSFIQMMDEVRGEDLNQGPATPIRTAFERAAERKAAESEIGQVGPDVILAEMPNWHLPEGFTFLDTKAKLEREGAEMDHCVGKYAVFVYLGERIILSICVDGKRATAELDRKGTVLQHRGFKNVPVNESSEAALNAMLKANGLPKTAE